jgi:hypothetical protein
MPKRPWFALSVAAVLALFGCDRQVFDHSSQRGQPDARPQSGADCSGALEGAACDDHDICTPRSVCRSGSCFGENPFDSCVVADTIDDFSNTQGDSGWWYGYWNAASDPDGSYDPDTDFSLMEYCETNVWMPPGCSTQGGRDWTQNLADGLQHAETDPYLELPVRRWVSDVSGKARVFAAHFINGGRSGDGTRAMLLLDGVEIWQHEALPGAMRGEATLDVELQPGTLLEQLIHPRASQGEDMSYFAISVAP